MHLVHEAVDGVRKLVGRIVAEMVRLAGLGTRKKEVKIETK